ATARRDDGRARDPGALERRADDAEEDARHLDRRRAATDRLRRRLVARSRPPPSARSPFPKTPLGPSSAPPQVRAMCWWSTDDQREEVISDGNEDTKSRGRGRA